MNDLSLKILLLLRRKNKADFRKLQSWMERNHWDEMAKDEGKSFTITVSNLLSEGYIDLEEIIEPDEKVWKAYHITPIGEAFLEGK